MRKKNRNVVGNLLQFMVEERIAYGSGGWNRPPVLPSSDHNYVKMSKEENPVSRKARKGKAFDRIYRINKI
jgi:hypothetical protein